MIKKRSLIYTTLRYFIVCTVIIFALMTPMFYLLTRFFYAEDLIDVIQSVESGSGIPPLDLERDIMAGMMMHFMLTFIILSMALFITVRFITRRLWQPFDDSLAKAERFNLERNDVPDFTKTDISEFDRLNDTLFRLMSKNSDAYRIQKEFTENASHELQTPLAVTRSKLDLLMQENLTEGQMSLVSELYQLNTRMGHLNRNLLLLAKIESAQYDRLEKIFLSEFVGHLLPSYKLHSDNCEVVFRQTNSDNKEVLANPVLLECILNNLVVNALRHTSGGLIVVAVENGNRLIVSNPSDGIPLNPEDVFRRFRSDNSGTGLGLAIVKAICDFHGWQIEYSHTVNRHMFTVLMA